MPTGRSSNGSKVPAPIPATACKVSGNLWPRPATTLMTRRSSRRPTVAVHQGVIALALGFPFLAQPLEAQQQPPDSEVVVQEEFAEDEVTVEEEVTEELTETVEVEPDDPVLEQPEVEQPRVLISEVLIEGIAGHPE